MRNGTMKPLFIAIAGGAVLIGSGLFVAGGFSATKIVAPRSMAAQVAGEQNAAQRAAATERTVMLRVDNMYCASCPYIVKQSLAAVPGVRAVSVSFRDKTALVTFDGAQTGIAALVEATTAMGYPSAVLKR